MRPCQPSAASAIRATSSSRAEVRRHGSAVAPGGPGRLRRPLGPRGVPVHDDHRRALAREGGDVEGAEPRAGAGHDDDPAGEARRAARHGAAHAPRAGGGGTVTQPRSAAASTASATARARQPS